MVVEILVGFFVLLFLINKQMNKRDHVKAPPKSKALTPTELLAIRKRKKAPGGFEKY
jgi:hypothetical protein